MKRFSVTQPINRKTVGQVPRDKHGVYRIKNAKGDILCIGKAKGGRLNDHIWERRGRFQRGTQFQYRITTSKRATDSLEHKEIRKYISPRNK